MAKLTRQERKKEIYEQIKISKDSSFGIKKISYSSPEEAIKRIAPSLLRKNKKP